ncbi:galactose-1-phosphate uridylyltransferase [Bythopirellula goksoeyrii]|uniref:galactose-1-phosphate uridylyltransferase n=1 Tax=Bythopirellula goksoeyrii TaxID=1400387 RepID=UPI0021BCC180|nr:galactose-1-phosphate uridylyltransferase [Bythopirellula goksoeyrii]
MDPVTGRRVLIAEGRAARPNDFTTAPVEQPKSHGPLANCPFCRGNEHQTPRELAQRTDDQDNWQVRVVPNKYPAVSLEPPVCESESSELHRGEVAAGTHEVIIDSPRHLRDWTELPVDSISEVLRVYADRLRHAYEHLNLPAALIFKNVGVQGGASLEHVHTQMMAFPFVPETLDQELQAAVDYKSRNMKCLYCEIIADELTHRRRLVHENDHYLAFCAYAGRQPYESWILPKKHAGSFTDFAEPAALAETLRAVIVRISGILPAPAYNLILHTAPMGDPRSDTFHWHWELIPRSTSLAGLEWGGGVFINSISPERAARTLLEINI